MADRPKAAARPSRSQTLSGSAALSTSTANGARPELNGRATLARASQTARLNGAAGPVPKAVSTKAVSTKAVSTKAVPTKAVPTKAAPTKASPAQAAASKAVPTKAAPTKAVPTKAVSTKAAPTKASPAQAVSAGHGDEWDQRLAGLLGFLRRRLTGQYPVDEFGFDPELTEALVHPALRLLYRHYFRVEATGAEKLPSRGPALVVANHSGTLPVDALMLTVAVHDETRYQRHLRLLGADLVFRIPLLSELARKGGSTLACNPDAERLLRSGEVVGVFPEGFKGIGKPYRDRYQLQRFGRGGFVAAALRTGTPIIPVSIVGAEEIYPILANLKPLARILGLPYVPVTPLFPWLGPLGMLPLPSKWLIEFGEPIETAGYAGDADDPIVVFNLADQVRETIQHTLQRMLKQRPDPFI